MLLIQQSSTDPYFNIATEEYLLRNFTENFFVLYINEPSIIVGKHQNTIAEINLDYVKCNNLKVVRRLSGGGTVYHDFGNLNYSFIANGSEGTMVDFKKFTQPIVEVLRELGVDAQIGGKNDIRVGSKKISGNAEHVYKSRVLHHGTLLFSSRLDELNESIKVDPNSYTDKAVKSIRSNVANISEFLKEPISINKFAWQITNHIEATFTNCQKYNLSDVDVISINGLIANKYSTWDWNFGYSPSYELERTISSANGEIKVKLVVEKGTIIQISFEAEYLNKSKLLELEQILVGCQHDIEIVSAKLQAHNVDYYFPSLTIDNLVKGLF